MGTVHDEIFGAVLYVKTVKSKNDMSYQDKPKNNTYLYFRLVYNRRGNKITVSSVCSNNSIQLLQQSLSKNKAIFHSKNCSKKTRLKKTYLRLELPL